MTRFAMDRRGERPAWPSFGQAAAARMIVKRSVAAAVMLCVGAALGSCAGTSNEDAFSAYVADHWPHWAGGMPSDTPPRPGAPGYNQFIAHGQADQDVLPPASGATAPAGPVTPVFQTAPSAAAASAKPVRPAPPAPSAQPAPGAPVPPQSASDNSNVVKGGLY
ncbi:MAG: hypothetical protein WAK35_01475 [Xanthobacteraceae bacterium]